MPMMVRLKANPCFDGSKEQLIMVRTRTGTNSTGTSAFTSTYLRGGLAESIQKGKRLADLARSGILFLIPQRTSSPMQQKGREHCRFKFQASLFYF